MFKLMKCESNLICIYLSIYSFHNRINIKGVLSLFPSKSQKTVRGQIITVTTQLGFENGKVWKQATKIPYQLLQKQDYSMGMLSSFPSESQKTFRWQIIIVITQLGFENFKKFESKLITNHTRFYRPKNIFWWLVVLRAGYANGAMDGGRPDEGWR